MGTILPAPLHRPQTVFIDTENPGRCTVSDLLLLQGEEGGERRGGEEERMGVEQGKGGERRAEERKGRVFSVVC